MQTFAEKPKTIKESLTRPAIGREVSPSQSHDPNSNPQQEASETAGIGKDFARIPAQSSNASQPLIQTKLVVGAVNDPHEQEADRVAESVIGFENDDLSVDAAGAIRKSGAPPVGSATYPAQDAGDDVASEMSNLQSGGTPLPEGTQSFFESRFGHDFSGVRIHSDSRAATLASTLNARAFTLGRDIVFGRGEYSPGTAGGNRLLAHELAHVVQQHSSQTTIQRQPKSQPPLDPAGKILPALSEQIEIIGEVLLPLHILDANTQPFLDPRGQPLRDNKGKLILDPATVPDKAAQDTLLFRRKLQAVEKLGELKNERAVITLIALIEDKIYGVQRLDATKKEILRSAAIDSLGQIGGTAALAKLKDLLNSQDPKEKSMAIHALSGASGSQVVANLLASLKAEKSIEVKASIITALGKVGAALGNQEKEALAIELIARMQGTDMGEVHGASIRALGLLKLKSSAAPLLDQYRLWLSDPKKTQDIVEALGEIGDDSAVDSLVPVLGTGSKFVKIAIANALGKIGGTKAIAALKKRLTIEADEDVKKAISKAIP